MRAADSRNVLALLAPLALTPLIAFAWTGPTASPPSGNKPAPVNVGTTDQVKDSSLGVNGLAVFGNTLLQSSAYLNWGTVAGSACYGIRDIAGVLEFKNSGGSWQSLQTIVFNLVGGSGSWSTSGNNIYNLNTGNVGIGTANPVATLDVTAPAGVDAQGHQMPRIKLTAVNTGASFNTNFDSAVNAWDVGGI